MEKLTKEQIGQMSPAQLRLAVAEFMEPKPPMQDAAVLRSMMDRDWRYSVAYLYSTGGRWRVNVGTDFDEETDWEPFYDYPSDIGAAWLVAEKMHKEWPDFAVGNHADKDGWCVSWGYDGYGWEHVIEDTAPMAICRAALYAAAESEKGVENG